jgi:hypothetical protein
MPLGDRTGPLGQGFRTGRGAGFCAGFQAPGSMNPAGRLGLGGWGGGRGGRNWFRATGLTGWQRGMAGQAAFTNPQMGGLAGVSEIQALKSEAASLKSALEAVSKKLENLEAKPKPE